MADSDDDAEFMRALGQPQPSAASVSNPIDDDTEFKAALSGPAPKAGVAARSSAPSVDYGTALQYGIANAVPFSHDLGAAVQAGETYFPKNWRPDDTGPEVSPGTSFSDRMAAQKAKIDATDKAVGEQHPYLSTGATIGASIGALPFAGPVEGISQGIANVAPRLGGLAADTAATGLVGAGYGALYGAGTGNSIDERLANAKSGAEVGGIGGALAAPLAAGAGKVIDALSPADSRASQKIAQAMAADRQTGVPSLSSADMAAANASGQPAVLADMGGQNVRRLARGVANVSPEGDATLSNLVNDRFEDQGPRLADFLQRTYGSNLDAGDARAALKAKSQSTVGPAYDAAMRDGANGVWTPGLANLLQSPAIQTAVRGATAKGANEAVVNGYQAVKNPFVETQNGSFALRQDANGNLAVPSLQFWDYVKRGLDDQIGSAYSGGQKDAGRQLTALKGSLTGELDQAVPSYATARQSAFNAFGADNALEAGENFLKMAPTAKTADMKTALANMTPQQKDIFSQGLASQMAQMALNTNARRNAIAMFNSPEMSQRLQLGMGAQKANEVEAFLRRESIMDMLRPAVSGNSTTAKQQGDAAALGHGVMGMLTKGLSSPTSGAVLGAAEGYREAGFDPETIARNAALGAGAGMVGKGFSSRNSTLMASIAKQLASGDPRVINAATNQIASTPPLMAALRKAEQGMTLAASRRGAANETQTPQLNGSFMPAMARAAGGSVKKPSHEFLVNRLMSMVEKAKKAEKERTKPLLSVPDDTVANALAAAQRTI